MVLSAVFRTTEITTELKEVRPASTQIIAVLLHTSAKVLPAHSTQFKESWRSHSRLLSVAASLLSLPGLKQLLLHEPKGSHAERKCNLQALPT